MSNVIYCFSGTGNCLSVARQLASKLGDTDVLSMMFLRDNKNIPAKYERVGFVFPTCFGHPSKAVSEIGNAMSLHSHQKPFIIATCGGWNILTVSDFRKILQTKTQNHIQCFSLGMPPNHIVGFSPMAKPVERNIIKRAEKKIEKIARKIETDKITRIKKDINLKLVTWMSKTFNGALGIKDIFSTKADFFTTEACTRCGICEKICPIKNITISSDAVKFGDNCQQCMACIQWCPQHAVAHPNVPKKRKRYNHPEVSVDDMIALAKGDDAPLN